MAVAIVHRQCNLCEAHCGLRVHVDGADVLEVTDEIRRGVVSVPHGYGHGRREGVGWKHAASLPGESVNDITDPSVLDAVTGNAAFNSVAVRVEAV